MRVVKPRVSALYKSACAECAAAGAALLPEDYAWLWDASQRAVDCGNECPSLLEVPVRVGNVVLYPRTLGAALWWQNYGQKWYGAAEANADEVVALAWLLAHARDKAVLEACSTRWRASAAILAWQAGLAWSVTVGELAWGIDRLFGQRDYFELDAGRKEADSASASDWGSVVARLCATYHRAPEYFLWEIGENAALELLEKAPLPDGLRREAAASGREYAEFVQIVRHLKALRKAKE